MRVEKGRAKILSAENVGNPETQVLVEIKLSYVGIFWLQTLNFLFGF